MIFSYCSLVQICTRNVDVQDDYFFTDNLVTQCFTCERTEKIINTDSDFNDLDITTSRFHIHTVPPSD
jgi:hypothetical protein